MARRADGLDEVQRRWKDSGQLAVALGDVRRPVSVRAAVAGHDIAISAIASAGRHPDGLFSDGTRTIVEALTIERVQRFVCVSSRGVNQHDPGLPLIYRRVIRPLFLREIYADMRLMEEVVRASSLDWTLVRAPKLVDAPARGSYRVEDGHNPAGGWSLSRADLSSFVLDQVDSREWQGRAPTPAY